MTSLAHRLQVRLLESVSELSRDGWDQLFGESCEGYDYLLACEQAPAKGFSYRAAAVFEGNKLIAGTPLFTVRMPFSLLLDGWSQRLAKLGGCLHPKLREISLLGVGSPHVDDLPFAFAVKIDAQSQQQIIRALDQKLDQFAAANGYQAIVWKNLDEQQRQAWKPMLVTCGYAPIAGLPVASLPVPCDEQTYINSLSANNRSTLRRKIKRAKAIRVEVRRNAQGLEDQLQQLREQTRAQAPTDYDVFEELGFGYFQKVLEHQPEKSCLMVYWDKAQLVGFSLLLIEPNQIKEKYTGLQYPQAKQYGLFFLNWMSILRLCQARGITTFRAGETTYLTKTRLGCQLQPSWLYVRHRNRAINWVLARVSRLFDLDAADPDLKKLGGPNLYRKA